MNERYSTSLPSRSGMWFHSDDSAICDSALSALCNVSVDIQKDEVSDITSDDLDAIVNAMRAHRNVQIIQKRAMILLRNFTFSQSNIEVMAQNKYLVPLIYSAMSIHNDHFQGRAQDLLRCITDYWTLIQRESIGKLAKSLIQCTEYCLLNVHVHGLDALHNYYVRLTGLGIVQPMHYLVLSSLSPFKTWSPSPPQHTPLYIRPPMVDFLRTIYTHTSVSMPEQRCHVPNVHNTMYLEFWLFVLIISSPHSYQYMRHQVKRIDARKWLRCPIRRNYIICGEIPSYTRLLGKFKILSKQQQHEVHVGVLDIGLSYKLNFIRNWIIISPDPQPSSSNGIPGGHPIRWHLPCPSS